MDSPLKVTGTATTTTTMTTTTNGKRSRLPLCAYINETPLHQPLPSPTPTPHAPVIRVFTAAAQQHGALEDDPMSSDPPEAPLSASSSFQHMLQSHLAGTNYGPRPKLQRSRSSSGQSSSSSSSAGPPSSSPYRVSHLSIQAGGAKGRRPAVVFSDTPLGSLKSVPRHHANSFKPYPRHKTAPVYSAYLPSPVTSSSPCRSDSPAARAATTGNSKRDLVSLEMSTPIIEDEDELELEDTDVSTDDEVEEEEVEALLLSQEQLALSPARLSQPLSSSISPSITAVTAAQRQVHGHSLKSILKRSKAARSPPALARDADEGSRLNSRRKHELNFDDCFRDPGANKRSVAAGTSASGNGRAGQASAGGGSAARAPAANKGKRPIEGLNAAAAAPGFSSSAGGEGSDDGSVRRDERKTADKETAKRTCPAPKDDDPILFESPLLTLSASLRSTSASTIRQRPGRASGDSSKVNALAMPLLLGDVEDAYVRLLRAAVRLPVALGSEERTLAPLRQHMSDLVDCLERDISNVCTFPAHTQAPAATSSSPPNVSPPSSRVRSHRVVLTDEMMRQLRDEVHVSQIAIKVVAALCRDARLCKLVGDVRLRTLIDHILAITSLSDASATVRRDVYHFVPFFIASQRLPLTFVASCLPQFQSSLVTTLRSTEKSRAGVQESLSALTHLLSTHPAQVLLASAEWFALAVGTLWDQSKRAPQVRSKAIATLASIARMMSSDEVGKGDVEWRKRKPEIEHLLSKTFSDQCSMKPKDAQDTNQTNIHVLEAQILLGLQPASPTATTVASALDDPRSLAAVSLLASIPVLLGPRFRQIAPRGVKPWIDIFNRVNNTRTIPIRTLSFLLWPHVVYAFCRSQSPAADGLLWVLRFPASKTTSPVTVLKAVLTGRRTHWQPQDLPPARKEKHRLASLALAHAVVGIVTGLTITVYRGSDTSVPTHAERNKPLDETSMDYFDQIFADVLVPELPLVIASKYEATPAIGWKLLASIVRPRSEHDRVASLDRLINPVLLDSSLLDARTGPVQDLFCQRAFGASTKPEDAPAWGSQWTIARADKLLGLFRTCLNQAVASSVPLDDKFLTDCALPVWRNLILSFAEYAGPTAIFHEQMGLAVRWLANLLTEDSRAWGASSLTPSIMAQAFVASTFETLGDRLVEMPPAEFGMTDEPWKFLLATIVDSCPPDKVYSVLERRWFAAAIQQAIKLPVSYDDQSSVLLLAIEKLKMSSSLLEQYLDLSEELASSWVERQLDQQSLAVLADLIRLHPRSADWLTLGRAVAHAAFNDSDASSLALRAALVEAATSKPHNNVRMFTYLLRSTRERETDLAAHAGLAKAMALSLETLFRVSGAGNGTVELIVNLFEATRPNQLDDIFRVVLELLPPAVDLSSADLETVLPLLDPVVSLLSASDDELDAHVDRFATFVKFWDCTYGTRSDINLPDQLVELIATLKKTTAHDFGQGVDETQSQWSQLAATHDVEARIPTAEHPRPAQSMHTEPNVPTHSTRLDATAQAYDADLSSSIAVELGTASTTTDDARARKPAAVSLSLHAPPDTTDRMADAEEEEEEEEAHGRSFEVEETPRDVERGRARVSYVESALQEQSRITEEEDGAVEADASAQLRAATEEGEEDYAASGVLTPSPELGILPSSPESGVQRSALAPQEEEEEEEVLYISSYSSSKASASGDRRASKNKKRSSSPGSVSSSSGSKRSSKKARLAAASAVSTGIKAQQQSAREGRALKRSASSSSLNESGETRTKRAKRGRTSTAHPMQSTIHNKGSRQSLPVPVIPSSSSSSRSDDSPPNSPGTEEVVRRFAMLPVEKAMRTAKKLGSPSLNRFMELGEQARRYLESLAGTNQRRSQS